MVPAIVKIVQRVLLSAVGLTLVLSSIEREATPESSAALDPTAALLAELIRVDTSNPPGHEGSIAQLLAPEGRPIETPGLAGGSC